MKKRAAGFATVLAASGLIAAAPAQATTVTIGSPGPAADISANIGEVGTIVTTSIGTSPVTAPSDGVITSWKLANSTGGPFYLQVVHPVGAQFMSTATSGPGVITGPGTLTFPANLPIAKGDFIGVANTSGSDTIGASNNLAASFLAFVPTLGASPRSPDGSGAGEIGYNAQVLLNCVVPKVKGKKVGAAKKALAKAGCAAPKIKKKGGNFVLKQSPKPGTEIRGDAAVKLKAGPKKK